MGFLKSPKVLMALAVAALLGMGLWRGSNLISDYGDVRQQVTRLEAAKEALEANLETAAEALKQAENAYVIAEEARARATERLRTYTLIEDQIDDTETADDAPLSPVLRNTLDALDRLR